MRFCHINFVKMTKYDVFNKKSHSFLELFADFFVHLLTLINFYSLTF